MSDKIIFQPRIQMFTHLDFTYRKKQHAVYFLVEGNEFKSVFMAHRWGGTGKTLKMTPAFEAAFESYINNIDIDFDQIKSDALSDYVPRVTTFDKVKAIARQTASEIAALCGDVGSSMLNNHIFFDGRQLIPQPAQGSVTNSLIYKEIKKRVAEAGIDVSRITVSRGTMD